MPLFADLRRRRNRDINLRVVENQLPVTTVAGIRTTYDAQRGKRLSQMSGPRSIWDGCRLAGATDTGAGDVLSRRPRSNSRAMGACFRGN
jgi:hypothetical protein